VVLGQQVSVAGATTLSGRLVERWGETLREPRGGLTHVFPTAERLARVDWSGIGIPRARARALHTLAREVAAGRLSLTSAADAERTTSALLAIPGIGPWTSQVVAMRALREPDAFPAGDLGLRKALANGGRPLSPREVEARSEAWRPWRAYAAMALWAGLSDSEER
jgi:AraC family transcriptional regulator of adaptative response / DNA-3-methyladenine glycosylase II